MLYLSRRTTTIHLRRQLGFPPRLCFPRTALRPPFYPKFRFLRPAQRLVLPAALEALGAARAAGVGTAAHRATDENMCVTISLELKFISQVKLDQELIGLAKVQKKTKSLVFLTCELRADDKITATASGIWKIIKK